MSSEDILSEIRRDYIYRLIRNGERIDGRKFDEYRNIDIELGPIERAEGSARVKIGTTDVLAGVKMQIGEPFPDTPNQGVIITNAELIPLASPTFEPGPPDENAIELARIVDRGIRGSNAIDLDKLCVDPGNEVWIIFIDLHILDHNGNLVDASSLAAIAALLNAKVPNTKFGIDKDDERLAMNDVPITTTSAEIDKNYIFDPCLDEENAANVELTVITTSKGELCGMQKTGIGKIPVDTVPNIIDSSINMGKKLREMLLKVVEGNRI
ncbi:MAG TPA: exosome complex protein Rrp42 [Halobacteria archaeon]|jgi:exosome complex component RRP42|nr:exosome complex protein Rrp42 [Halobacteria archaeon]